MAKNTNRVATAIAYVAALGLATGALAAHWEMTVNNPVTYAKEIFGGDDPASTDLELQADTTDETDDPGTTDVIEGDEQTSIDLKLYLPSDGGMSVGSGSEVEVTVTLDGATLSNSISWTDIRVAGETIAETTGFSKVGGSQENGRSGDDHVSFRVQWNGDTAIAIPADNNPGGALPTGYFIRIGLEEITGYDGGGMVTATAEFTVTDGPSNNFPTESVHAPRDATTMVAAVPADPGATPPVAAVEAVIGVDAVTNMIANSASAMTFSAANGGAPGQINLDDRTALDGTATKVEVASFTYGRSMRNAGTADMPMMVPVDAKTADGMTLFAENEGTEANVMVTVEGMVRDGDTIWFDRDGDGMMGSRETLSISGDSASRTFRIDDIVSGNSVYFQPNGTDEMTDGNLKATFAIEYDEEDAVTPADKSGMVALEYAGISKQARAYAIPQPDLMDTGMTDVGWVRIKCHAEGESTCTVFLDCDEQDGTRHFEELGDTIGSGVTVPLNSAAIAGLLPKLTGGTWTGRLSCDVFSDEAVSVQVLVRNRTGHPLINNTYIEGGPDN